MAALFQLIHISIADGYNCVVELGVGSTNTFFFSLSRSSFSKSSKNNQKCFRRLKYIEIEDFNEKKLNLIQGN